MAGMQDATTPFPRPLLILKTGDTYEELRAPRGDFEHWVALGLDAAGELPLLVLDPRQGDALPEADDIAGVVVTGSHSMVSHREPWSERTAAWLAGVVREDRVPVLGICYGHQLLAHALGGEVGNHPAGREMGTVRLELHPSAAADPLFAGLPASFPAQATHLQTVLRAPDGATVLARSGHDACHAFRWGERAWGVQFHPEFSAGHMRGYVRARQDALRNEGLCPRTVAREVSAAPHARRVLRRFVGHARALHGR